MFGLLMLGESGVSWERCELLWSNETVVRLGEVAECRLFGQCAIGAS